ncbi:MAG: hypothetical protein ACYDEY_13865 [Acidimicrobiales bacterium]
MSGAAGKGDRAQVVFGGIQASPRNNIASTSSALTLCFRAVETRSPRAVPRSRLRAAACDLHPTRLKFEHVHGHFANRVVRALFQLGACGGR